MKYKSTCLSFIQPSNGYMPIVTLLVAIITLLSPLRQLSAQELPYCDVSAYTVNLYNYNLSNVYPGPNPIVWDNVKIRVGANATVRFDKNVIMTRCTVRMEPNSRIIVENGSTLTTSQQTIFFGCSAMWDAIEVGAGCTYNLTDTEIRDATRGLALLRDNKSSVFWLANNCKVQNCTFRNNLVGITVDYSVGTGDNLFVPSVFSNNLFTGTSGVPLLAPLATQSPRAAIEFNSCGFTVIPANNTYKFLDSGIRSDNSFVAIQGGTFERIRFEAVSATTSILNVENANFTNIGTMVNSSFGRYLGVKNCTLTDGIEAGIAVTGTSLNRPPVFIDNNILRFIRIPRFAIKVERSPDAINNGWIQNRIDHNIIDIYSLSNHIHDSKMIDITAPSGGQSYFAITDDEITVDGVIGSANCHGIFITNDASSYSVSDNKLYYNSTNPPNNGVRSPNLGIVFENVNGQYNEIINNEVNSNLFANPWNEEASSWMKCAYHIDQSANLRICHNKGNHTYRLFHFSGSLNYCDFAKNTINEHYYGALCAQQPGSDLTNMGDQKWHENTWLTTASSYIKRSAEYRDNITGNLPFIFKVYPNTPTQNPPSPFPPNWFVTANQTPPEDVENSSCVGGTFVASGLGGWDKNVIEGTYPYASAAQAWDMQRELLYKLLEHPDYRPAGSTASTWYNSLTSSSAWKYANFERLFYQAHQPTVAAQTALNDAQKQCGDLMREYIRLDSLQNLNVTTDDPNLRQQQLSTAGQLVSAKGDLYNKQGQVRTSTQTALANTQNTWTTLPATSVWESNRKALYSYWLMKAQGTALTTSDYASIRSIANQCPQEGGMAIREIPLFLPTTEANIYSREDYWVDCVEEVKPRREQAVAQLLTNTLMVLPNPADQQISLFLGQVSEATWTITDLNGRTWQRGQMTSGQPSAIFDTQSIPSGLYFCTVRTHTGLVLTAKVIIQH